MSTTRQRLLDAARECVRDHGIAATTSRLITGTAGANLGAITYHFGSKDQLVAEALLDGLRQWLDPALEVLSGGGEPTARMIVAVETLMTTFEHHREEAGAYLEALVQAPRMELLHRGLLELWAELRQLLEDQMAEMRRQGQLSGWVDATAMAGLIVAVANGLVLHVNIDPHGPDLRAMASQFGALLVAPKR